MREKRFELRLSGLEFSAYQSAADRAGLPVASWMRMRLNLGLNGKVAESHSADVGRTSAKARRGSPTKNVASVALRDGESDEPARPKEVSKPQGHDVKNCRVYGCLSCVAAGKKF